MRAEIGRQSLFNLSWECAHGASKMFAALHMYANDHESMLHVDFGVVS